MSVSYIGSTVSANAAAATSIGCTVHASTVDGDLIIWEIAGAASSIAFPGTPPAGWSVWQAAQLPIANGGRITFYRRASGDAGVTYTYSGLTSGRYSASMKVFRGVHALTPKDVANVTSTSSTTTAPPPAITPVTAGAMIVGDEMVVVNSASVTPTWSTTNGVAVVAVTVSTIAGQSNAGQASTYLLWVSGATTPDLQKVTGTINGGAGLTYALRPAPLTDTETDNAGLTDQLVIARGIATTDPSGLSDALTLTRGVTLDDPGGMSDAIAIDRTQRLTDNAGLTDDAPTMLWDRGVIVTDDTGLADALVVDRATVLPDDPTGLTDTIAIDQARVIRSIPGSLDYLILTDQLVIDRTMRLTDTAGLSDAGLVVTWARGRILDDPAGLTDSLTIARSLVLADVAGLTDALVVSLGRGLSIDDPTGLTDALTIDRTSRLTDTAGLSDQLIIDRRENITDNAGLTDQIVLARSRSITDNAGLTDALIIDLTVGGSIKVYNGLFPPSNPLAWDLKPLKVWDGVGDPTDPSSWVTKQLKAWDGVGDPLDPASWRSV